MLFIDLWSKNDALARVNEENKNYTILHNLLFGWNIRETNRMVGGLFG